MSRLRVSGAVAALALLLALGCRGQARYDVVDVDGFVCRVDTQSGEVVCTDGFGSERFLSIPAGPYEGDQERTWGAEQRDSAPVR